MLRWGRQSGRVNLSDRKLRVAKPRLRKRSGGEVKVPAYESLQDDERLGSRMLDILMKGVSTRQYAGVIGEMADTVGVSKSAISRDTIEAAEKKIDELFARRFDDVDLLVIYVDGLIFSGHTVLAAVGVDAEGNKHVLGLQHAATENAAAAEDLLTFQQGNEVIFVDALDAADGLPLRHFVDHIDAVGAFFAFLFGRVHGVDAQVARTSSRLGLAAFADRECTGVGRVLSRCKL